MPVACRHWLSRPTAPGSRRPTKPTDAGGTVRIWDTTTGHTRHILIGHTHAVSALAVVPDASWLASADEPADAGGTVRIWDTATGSTRHMLVGHTGKIRALVVASDGSWLASADSLAEGGSTVRIWNPVTGTCETSLRTAHRLKHLTAFDDHVIAAGDRGPYLWKLASSSRD
jgi:WD40 repeat protein